MILKKMKKKGITIHPHTMLAVAKEIDRNKKKPNKGAKEVEQRPTG